LGEMVGWERGLGREKQEGIPLGGGWGGGGCQRGKKEQITYFYPLPL